MRQILLVCVCALTPASAASAKTWPARFVSINDGDTIDARVGGHVYTIRTSGIQAMEQHHYSADPKKRTGECNAVEATARLEQLIHESHGQLRLSAQDPSSHAGHRLRRNIAVRIRGRWLDTGLIEIREGHALWMSGKEEDKWNRAYNLAEQRARIDGKGLWDPTHCGVGPYQDVPLRLWVNWDPPGIDNLDVNGEFIKIQNQGTRTVDLSHWWVRDSMLERYTFPSGAQLPPGATVTVRTGHGTNTAGTFYWGRDSPVFENALGPNSPEGANRGDGGYLFDPQGDLRAAMIYPCLIVCSDSNQGALQVMAHPRRPESIAVRNISDHPVDLYGYALAIHGSMYPFGEWPPLGPGQTVQVDVGGDPANDTALHRFWGLSGLVLPDAGGWARVETFSAITLACDAWGSDSC